MAGIAMTGGTAAPSVRQQAAQRAVKAPRVAAQHAQPTTLGRRSGGTRNGGGGTRAQGGGKTNASPSSGPVAFNPVSGFLNTQQLGHLADQITRQNMQAQLSPLRQQAGEISGTESTVSKRYGGYTNSTDQLLQGIGKDAEAQAKTYENQAADAVLKAGNAINQTGQTAVAQNGGYLDPQVQAQLNAEGKLAVGIGSAQNSFAANAGQGEESFMSNLRAAAVQRALEGQRGISTLYGNQLAKNQSEQDRLLARQPAEAKSLAATLGQQQFTDYATLRGLGIKQEGLNAQAQQDHEKNRLTERGQNITVSRDTAHARLEERKIVETERHNRASEATSAEQARAEVKKANGGLTTNEQDSLSGELGTAYNIVQQLRSGKNMHSPQEIRNTLTTGSRKSQVEAETPTGKKYWKSVTLNYPKIGNQSVITAAIELWYHHRISGSTAQALAGMGLKVPQDWTNGQFKGF